MELTQILFCLLAFATLSAEGLKCFSCTMTFDEGAVDPDMTCVEHPDQVVGKNIITCPTRMKFCTIVRDDYKSTGAVSSIERNCAEKPVVMNEDIEGDKLITHYRTCQTDLCNKGTGIESADEGSGGSGGGMIVPGRSNGALITSSYSLPIFLLAVIFMQI